MYFIRIFGFLPALILGFCCSRNLLSCRLSPFWWSLICSHSLFSIHSLSLPYVKLYHLTLAVSFLVIFPSVSFTFLEAFPQVNAIYCFTRFFCFYCIALQFLLHSLAFSYLWRCILLLSLHIGKAFNRNLLSLLLPSLFILHHSSSLTPSPTTQPRPTSITRGWVMLPPPSIHNTTVLICLHKKGNVLASTF